MESALLMLENQQIRRKIEVYMVLFSFRLHTTSPVNDQESANWVTPYKGLWSCLIATLLIHLGNPRQILDK